MATEPQQKTFALYIPDSEDVTHVEGRMRAVRRAKTWSQEQTYPVKVERNDGRVNMTFRDGELVRYGFGRRRRRS
ncbi:MAG TPA: hypothetical protein RMH99_30475 [Sandaracinaceae bacterium LLY-WYZ-13_1]|nr:hypothetical protein [Sandaracinaceae bacterium LLY-WYZ-13_1]